MFITNESNLYNKMGLSHKGRTSAAKIPYISITYKGTGFLGSFGMTQKETYDTAAPRQSNQSHKSKGEKKPALTKYRNQNS